MSIDWTTLAAERAAAVADEMVEKRALSQWLELNKPPRGTYWRFTELPGEIQRRIMSLRIVAVLELLGLSRCVACGGVSFDLEGRMGGFYRPAEPELGAQMRHQECAPEIEGWTLA